MGELLLLGPLDIELGAFVVVVVVGVGTSIQGSLVVKLLGLGEPGTSRLSPTMVEIEEHVIQILVLITNGLDLIVVRRNVADLIKILWSHLTYV